MNLKQMKLLASLFVVIDGGAEELSIEGVQLDKERFHDSAKLTVRYMGEQDLALGALERAGYVELKRENFRGELASPYTYEVSITRKGKGLLFQRLADVLSSQPPPETAPAVKVQPTTESTFQVEGHEGMAGPGFTYYRILEHGRVLVEDIEDEAVAKRIAHALRVVEAHPELAAK